MLARTAKALLPGTSRATPYSHHLRMAVSLTKPLPSNSPKTRLHKIVASISCLTTINKLRKKIRSTEPIVLLQKKVSEKSLESSKKVKVLRRVTSRRSRRSSPSQVETRKTTMSSTLSTTMELTKIPIPMKSSAMRKMHASVPTVTACIAACSSL